MRLLFLGPPGVGKGTQAANVACALGIAHISTGDMFRRHIKAGTPLGARVGRLIADGELVPDDLTVEMLTARIELPDAGPGFILDGFPRTIAQARALDAAIGREALDSAVVLEAPVDVLVERMLSRGRADDTEATVRNRLAVYETETAPVVRLYQERDIVVRVSGVGKVRAITDQIVAGLLARHRP